MSTTNGSKKYDYRVNGNVVSMTPQRAAYYAERHDVRVEPVTTAPLAPEGQLEATYSLQEQRR